MNSFVLFPSDSGETFRLIDIVTILVDSPIFPFEIGNYEKNVVTFYFDNK
jgi:hypothetical protein